METHDLAQIRRDFESRGLDESEVSADPFEQFAEWLDAALAAELIDANAMTVATADSEGRPSARVVLLKGYDRDGFVFFTNYASRKSRDLAENPYASMHFFWPQLDRQITISGSVTRTSAEESEAYFRSRPVDSRLSAWASKQSSIVASRAELEKRVDELRQEFGDDPPLPDFWGGFRLAPERFEFWQGRQNRLHDRIEYRLIDGGWSIARLSP